MKPISNYRNHPALRYNEQKWIFKLDSAIYLFTEKEVKRIFPLKIERTNIGEPYRELVRFYFEIEGEENSIDIDPNDLEDLLKLIG